MSVPRSKPTVNLEVYVQIEQSVSANVFESSLCSERLETRLVNCVLFWSGLYEWERRLPARAAKASRAWSLGFEARRQAQQLSEVS